MSDKRYRCILVPLDGSTLAEHALPLALSIARRAGATLQLVLVHLPFRVGYLEGKTILSKTLKTRLREQALAYLEEVSKRLAVSSDIPITSALIDGKVGQVADILNHHVKATGADLMVMTTHGHGPVTRFWIGSVADKLMRQASTPILLVRPQETVKEASEFAPERVFQHILIPLDGSTLAEEILKSVVMLGTLMQANYTLLRVIEPVIPFSYPRTEYLIRILLKQQILQQREAEAQIYLEGVAERLRGQVEAQGPMPVQVQIRTAIHRQPAVAILEEAGKHRIDLIAMETHGRGGLSQLFFGSVADKVVRAASIPVLLHHPHGKPSHAEVQ